MSYITGFDRNQAVLIPETISQLIDTNNLVRFIDSLQTADFGFRNPNRNINGRVD